MQRRWGRIAMVAGSTWLLYLLVGNLLLNTALGEQLVNRKPERFHMEWQGGLTLWPGRVTLWGLKLRGHVRQVEWFAHADRARGRIAVVPLLSRTLAVPELTADEVYTLLRRAEHDLPPPDAGPDGWTLRFDGIQTDSLRSLRIRDVRLSGAGHARVAFRKTLRGGAIEIGPSTVRMRELIVADDDRQWLTHGQLELGATLVSPTTTGGIDWPRLLDARLALEGVTPGLRVRLDDGRWLTDILPLEDMSAAARQHDSGRLTLDLAMAHGELLEGGHARLALPLDALTDDGHRWRQNAGLDLTVADDIRLQLELPPPPGDEGGIRADIGIAGRELPDDGDWQAQLRRVSGDIDLRWHFQSLRWLAPAFARAPWLRLDGAGFIESDIRIVAGDIVEGSRLLVPEVQVEIDVLDNRITGQAHAQARITGSGADLGSRSSVVVDRFQMAPREASDQAPDQVYVQGRDLRLDITATGPPGAARESLKARMAFSDALVPDLRIYNDYLPAAGLRITRGRATLSGELEIDAAGEVGRGEFRVDASQAEITLGDLELGGDVALVARLRGVDVGQRRFDLGGSRIEVAGLRALDEDRPLGRDWWGTVTFPDGHLDWGRPLSLDARLDARTMNVALVLALFAHRRDYPNWLFRLVDDGEARLHGRVQMDGRGVTLEPMRAGNDRFDVQARLRLREQAPVGQLLAEWGRLAAAVELADGDRRWHLRGAREWFAGQRLPAD